MLFPSGNFLSKLGYLVFGWMVAHWAKRQLTQTRQRRLSREQERRLEAQAADIHRKLVVRQRKDPSSVPVDLLHVTRDELICLGAYYLDAEVPRNTLEALETDDFT